MPLYLKQSTQVSVPVGPLFDSTDFISEEAAVAYDAAGIDVDVIKSGTTKADVTLANSAGDGYWRHVSNGNYALTLSTTDTNTLGSLRVTFKATGVLDWWQDFEVVPAAVYDSIIAGSDKLPVDVQEVSSDETAANNLEAAFDGTGYAGGTTKQVVEVNTKTGFSLADGSITAATIATDAIDGDAVAASAVSEIQSGLATSSSITTLDGKVDTVDGVVDAIKLKTDTIPANPAAVGSEMAVSAASISSIQSGLSTFDPTTDEVDLGAVKGVAVTSVDDFKADVSGLALTGEAATAVGTLNDFDPALETVTVGTNNDKTGYALSAAGVSAVQSGLSTLTAQQVWEYGTRTLSSFGTLVADITTAVWGAGTRTLSSFGTLIADTWAYATRSLTDKADFTLASTYDAAKSAAAAGAQMDLVNAPNATAVAAIQSGLATSSDISSLNDFDPATEEVNVGSVKGVAVTGVDDFKADVSGLALTGEAATAVATLTIPSAADNADAVWNEARVDHSTAGSFGQGVASVQGNVTGSVDSVTDPVTVGTNNDKTDYALSAAGVSAVQSGLSTLTAQQVWEYGARTLSSFGTLVSDVATGVWGAGTRTLSGFGTLVTDLWEHATRSLTDKADFTLTAAYDPAKNAASPDDVTTAVSGLSTFDPSTTEVDIGAVKGVAVTSVADFKADVSGLAATGEAATAVGTLSIPTAADNADAVWDEVVADHTEAGSTGNALTAAGSAGDPWSTTLPGAYGDNTAGKILGVNLDTTVSSRSTLTAAQVWANGTRTLSSFGSLVADVAAGVWGAVARTITGGTVTTNSDKSGYSLAADQAVNVTKVGGTVVTGPDDLKADVSELATSAEVGALNDLSTGDVETAVGTALGTYDGPTKAELDSAVSPLATAAALTTVSGKVDTVDTVVDAIKLKTDNLPASPAAVGSAMTLSAAERTAIVTAMLAGTITYPDGSTKTLEGLLEEVWATTAGDTNIVELVQSFIWPDGATVALTYELDDADAPTSRTRQ